MGSRSTEQCSDARLEFRHLKGLYQVVVGTGIQAGDFVRQPIPPRDNENGQLPGLLAQAANQIQAADTGKIPVDDRQIEGFRRCRFERTRTISESDYFMTGSLEQVGQRPTQFIVVLDNEEPSVLQGETSSDGYPL